MFWGKKPFLSLVGRPEPSGVSSVPPAPSSRRSQPPPAPSFKSRFKIPQDTTIRSLECWSNHGCAGDRLSDAYAARAALAYGGRYGLNRFGRLIFVFVDSEKHGNGRVEYEIQSNSFRVRQDTLMDDTQTLAMLGLKRKLK